MDLFYDEEYSKEEVLGASENVTEYDDGRSLFVRTEQGLVFLGRMGVPPSCVSPLAAEFPYFLHPDSLWILFQMRYWFGGPLLPGEHPDQLSHSNETHEPAQRGRNGGVCDALMNRLNCIVVFGCNSDSNEYYYLGQGLLTMCSGDQNQQDLWRIHYRLGGPISREMWIGFGGYSHWIMVIGEQEFTIRSYEEAAPLIDSLWGKAASTLMLTRYEGDVLRVGVNQRNEAGVIYVPVKGHAVYTGHFHRECEWVWFGEVEEYAVPAPTLISREQAMNVIKSFMTTGRPVGLRGFPE